jgi:hypothetical protein
MFELVPPDRFAAFDESANHFGQASAFLQETAKLLGKTCPEVTAYFNLGIHLVTRFQTDLYAPPEQELPRQSPEQHYVNFRLMDQGVKVFKPDSSWNCMPRQQVGRYWQTANFIHYSSSSLRYDIARVQSDLARFRKLTPKTTDLGFAQEIGLKK